MRNEIAASKRCCVGLPSKQFRFYRLCADDVWKFGSVAESAHPTKDGLEPFHLRGACRWVSRGEFHMMKGVRARTMRTMDNTSNDRKASAGCWVQSYRAPDQRPTGAPESRPGDQKRAAFGATCVVREQITLRRAIHQGSLQDSPPTKLLVRAWSQASQSTTLGRRG